MRWTRDIFGLAPEHSGDNPVVFDSSQVLNRSTSPRPPPRIIIFFAPLWGFWGCSAKNADSRHWAMWLDTFQTWWNQGLQWLTSRESIALNISWEIGEKLLNTKQINAMSGIYPCNTLQCNPNMKNIFLTKKNYKFLGLDGQQVRIRPKKILTKFSWKV